MTLLTTDGRKALQKGFGADLWGKIKDCWMKVPLKVFLFNSKLHKLTRSDLQLWFSICESFLSEHIIRSMPPVPN